LPHDARLTATRKVDLFGGVHVITGDAVRVEPTNWHDGLYQPQTIIDYSHSPLVITAIPYCFWANREPGEMRVWLREV
jgi:DUF1680 family protein